MKKIKTIFIGTAAIGCPLLESLYEDNRFDVLLVVTGQDKPAGRKMELSPSPVKQVAEEFSIPLFQPKSINSDESLNQLKNLTPDIIILMAYGQILSPDVLSIPKIECFNVHASILPQHRGASPVQSTLLDGDTETGISLMKMIPEMDAGPVFEVFKMDVLDDDTTISLSEKLGQAASQEIPSAIARIIEKEVPPIPQNDSEATFCSKISKGDGNIDWNEDAGVINAKIKAYAGWPSAYSFFHGKRLKIISAKPHEIELNGKNGTVVKTDDFLGIKCNKGAIEPVSVQMEGKMEQSITDFLNGNPDFINSVLTATP